MTPDEAVEALDRMSGADPESAHGLADDILLDALPPEVREAYRRLQRRCRWWACA